jgi:hypothetical protein
MMHQRFEPVASRPGDWCGRPQVWTERDAAVGSLSATQVCHSDTGLAYQVVVTP